VAGHSSLVPRIVVALLAFAMIGISSCASATAGGAKPKPLKDYSVGGDIVMNVPIGTSFSIHDLNVVGQAECAEGEPSGGYDVKAKRENEYFKVILRVINSVHDPKQGDVCVARKSYIHFLVTSQDFHADIAFVQTSFGTFTDGEFELRCPGTASEIHNLTCDAINQRTIRLTQHIPATLSCNDVKFDNHAPQTYSAELCDVGGWPPPPLKVVGLGPDGRVLNMTVERSPEDRSKVVLVPHGVRVVGLTRIGITADAPPYPTQNVKIDICQYDREEEC
jgi:hypothetical protein